MKKVYIRITQWAVIFTCFTLFIVFKVRSHTHPPLTFTQPKPCLPAPTVQHCPSVLLDKVYLGETALGLPFYLDVRQFELKGGSSNELIAWYLDLLEGPYEELFVSDQRKIYVRKGARNPSHSDTTHGFAAMQGERGLFLDCYIEGGKLYMCSAEAPLETFQEHEEFFRSLCKKEVEGLLLKKDL